MRAKYYEDDIVEVLNGECRGDRFYVKNIFEFKGTLLSLKAPFILYPSITQVKLWHRPLKNHIKYFINMLLSGIKIEK